MFLEAFAKVAHDSVKFHWEGSVHWFTGKAESRITDSFFCFFRGRLFLFSETPGRHREFWFASVSSGSVAANPYRFSLWSLNQISIL